MVEKIYLINKDNEIDLKIAIAKNLYKKYIDQSRIANILKISQPMVSIYCKKETKISKSILGLANDISKNIIENKNDCFFQTCVTFKNDYPEDKYYLGKENEIISNENKKIIDNLSEAYIILKDIDIDKLVPKIKINIAMAKNTATKTEDIASFLNGFVIADDKITGHNGIRFGKSKHLSNLLLYLKSKSGINAIMNIAYVKDIKKTNLKYSFLTKDYKIKTKNKIDVLQHEGDFGIEPCTYVIGNNAVDVANKVIKIKEEI